MKEILETLPDLISLCQQLVRAPSFSGDERHAAEIVARALHDFDFDAITTDAFGSVIGIRRGARPGKMILLDAHLDVAPILDRDAWTRDPFGGEIADGKIWGRGACDDKGALAAMICAAGNLPRDSFAGQIIISASVCEENLTGAAFARIFDHHRADVVIIGEPTELQLGVAQKGRAGIAIHTRGKSAHTSRPELGENAMYKMLDAITRLRAIALPRDPQLGQGILELIEIASAPMPGTGFVPHACRARFVARTLPGESRDLVLARVQNALVDITGCAVELEQLAQVCYTGATLAMDDFIPGWRVDANDEWLPKMVSALRAAGLPDETFAAPFGTNASVSAARDIPTFIFGPGSIAQAHVVDEWIAVDELIAGERSYREIIRAVAAS